MTRTVVVAGVGERLGTALAREFADAGDDVGLLARSPEYVESLAAELRETGVASAAVTADVTDREAVAVAFDDLRAELGAVDVLVHNASAPGGRLDAEDFGRPLDVRAVGGANCAREALSDMRAGDDEGATDTDGDGSGDGNEGEPSGTILFSGTDYAFDGTGDLPGWTAAAYATRGLARSLAKRFGPEGVHVCYVAVGGAIPPADGYVTADRMDPAAVATAFRRLSEQPRSAWTTELDLRPDHQPP